MWVNGDKRLEIDMHVWVRSAGDKDGKDVELKVANIDAVEAMDDAVRGREAHFSFGGRAPMTLAPAHTTYYHRNTKIDAYVNYDDICTACQKGEPCLAAADGKHCRERPMTLGRALWLMEQERPMAFCVYMAKGKGVLHAHIAQQLQCCEKTVKRYYAAANGYIDDLIPQTVLEISTTNPEAEKKRTVFQAEIVYERDQHGKPFALMREADTGEYRESCETRQSRVSYRRNRHEWPEVNGHWAVDLATVKEVAGGKEWQVRWIPD
jgi:hypothetical protein